MAITRATGTVSENLNVFIRNTNLGAVSTIGMANVSASSIYFSWKRDNQATLSSGTCTAGGTIGTYSVSTLTQISSTSTLGWYQFCPDNGMFASGRSAILHLWSRTSTAGHQTVQVEVDLLGNIQPVSVSTFATDVSSVTGSVNVSSATVDFGVSTIAVAQKLVGVSTIAVGEKLVGVSTIAVGEKLVGVSTIAAAQKLVGVSTMTTPVGVSSASVDFGVSTIAVAEKLVGVSTIAAAQKLVGVSTVTVQVGVSTLATSVSSVTGSVNVSSYSALVGVSTMAVSVDVSSASVNLGVSTLAGSVDVSSLNSAPVIGTGTPADLWRGV